MPVSRKVESGQPDAIGDDEEIAERGREVGVTAGHASILTPIRAPDASKSSGFQTSSCRWHLDKC
jgi:hypothetical protein